MAKKPRSDYSIRAFLSPSHAQKRAGPITGSAVSFLMSRHHASLPPVHVLFDFLFLCLALYQLVLLF